MKFLTIKQCKSSRGERGDTSLGRCIYLNGEHGTAPAERGRAEWDFVDGGVGSTVELDLDEPILHVEVGQCMKRCPAKLLTVLALNALLAR